MSALKFTRNKDYSDESNNNAGGRDTVDCAGLDGEMDEILTVTDDHADLLDVLLRDDELMQDNILQGHEFSTLAVQTLNALINSVTALAWASSWTTATDYAVGTLVYETNSTWICKVEHTSGVFATDLAAGKWEIFALGATGLPGGAASDDILYWNGATAAWAKITAAMAPLHALIASPTFTGEVTVPDLAMTGRFKSSVLAVSFSAAAQTIDFNAAWMKTINVSGDYTSAITVTNVTQGEITEVHMTNTKGSDAALLWDSNWTWMGYAPSVLPNGKKAVLSLRAPTGAAATDVIALWSVEP
ncbi:MAG: hypothetical protein KJO69_02315 [Gammaproteobacteria bacterium]|nr:hypothetical protein [Gammaproteobacteria bacterium]